MIHFLGSRSVLEYLGSLSVLEYFHLKLSHLSSSGMWIAIMETGSSLRSDHPRMSESLRAWFTLKGMMMMMMILSFNDDDGHGDGVADNDDDD